jgi:hypothetical protein
MADPAQGVERRIDDRTAAPTLNVGDKADTAGVALVTGVVQTLGSVQRGLLSAAPVGSTLLVPALTSGTPGAQKSARRKRAPLLKLLIRQEV